MTRMHSPKWTSFLLQTVLSENYLDPGTTILDQKGGGAMWVSEVRWEMSKSPISLEVTSDREHG